MAEGSFDLAIIGGGVNGCGIARAAAARGFSVFLAEQDDLGHATSSASTKLIHGGLRYLEHREFRLVRESLREREVLWRMAPNLIEPARFVLPHHEGLRPAWLLRLGLLLYDHLGGRRLLPATRTLRLDRDPAGAALKPGYRRAFAYSDCRVDDARLVVALALDAARHGAQIAPRTRSVTAHREAGAWALTLEDRRSGERRRLRARALVNAAGPWVAEVREMLGAAASPRIRLVRGSHIVVRRRVPLPACYVFQERDGRIVFALPYEGDLALIGTTDVDHDGPPEAPQAAAEEVAYLRAVASEYLAEPIAAEDVVWRYSGVRPLVDDGHTAAQDLTRDYVLTLDAPAGGGALLTVLGGKITTFRRLAEAAIGHLLPYLPPAKPWAPEAPLPGGDFAVDGMPAIVSALAAEHPYLGTPLLERLVRAYGTRAKELLARVTRDADMGLSFGHGLSEREVAWLMMEEWAETAEDVLWRRSKLGLRFTSEEAARLEEWIAERRGAAAVSVRSE